MIYVRSALKCMFIQLNCLQFGFSGCIPFSLYFLFFDLYLDVEILFMISCQSTLDRNNRNVECDFDLWRVHCQQRPPLVSRRTTGTKVSVSGPWPGGQGGCSSAWLLSSTLKWAVCAASAYVHARRSLQILWGQLLLRGLHWRIFADLWQKLYFQF